MASKFLVAFQRWADRQLCTKRIEPNRSTEFQQWPRSAKGCFSTVMNVPHLHKESFCRKVPRKMHKNTKSNDKHQAVQMTQTLNLCYITQVQKDVVSWGTNSHPSPCEWHIPDVSLFVSVSELPARLKNGTSKETPHTKSSWCNSKNDGVT